MVTRQPVVGLVRDVVVDVSEAIGDELTALAAADHTALDLRNGRLVGAVGSHRLWSFDLDTVPPVPPETPGRLVLEGRDPLRATILAIGDADLVIGVEDDLGQVLPRAALSVEPWFILDALRERLAEQVETGGDIPLTHALLDLDDLALHPPPTPTEAAGAGAPLPLALSGEQHQAAAHAALPGLRFVWGPPGTGKTSTLAAAAALLATGSGPCRPPPHRVLVVAHANAAVDVAVARVADALAGSGLVEDGRVLRVGTPHLPIARDRPEILPDEIIARDHPDLIRRRKQLEAERRTLSARMKAARDPVEQAALTATLEDIRADLAEIAGRLRDARAVLVQEAAIVGTTLSKLVLDDLLWRWPSDAVIVDESSMSGLPFLLAVALRGASTLACFGDFRQLPPIAVSGRESTRLWFGRDVFELAGVVSRFDADLPDPRFTALRTQYRMGRAIGSVVGRFAYYDLLRTDPEAAARAEDVALLPPLEGTQIVVVDTTDLATSCVQEVDPESFSRLNLLSAALTASLAHLVAGTAGAGAKASVGVVAPYRAQARVLEVLLRGHPAATAATTHRFQGSERDVVLVDLTDAAPQEGPSRLTGRDPGLALRLLNVGISRARGKLVLVADLGFLAERHPSTSPARALVDLAVGSGAATVPAAALLPRLEQPASIRWAPTWDAAIAELVEQHSPDQTAFDVNVGTEDQAGAWLDHMAAELPPLGHSVTVRAPVPVALRLEATPVELKLRTVGPAPIAFAGEGAMAVGSTDPAGPAACITDGAAVVAARRRLLAE